MRSISTAPRHDLDAIRRIRNAFAHARRKIDFDTPGIKSLCQGMNARSDVTDWEAHSTQTVFVSCCEIIMLYLITKIGPYPGDIPFKVEGLESLDGASEEKLMQHGQETVP